MRLTKRQVEAAERGARDVFLWDSAVPGFGLRVLPSGKRSYLVQYRVGRRTRRLALGLHGTLTAEQARGLAREALASVRHGGDPSATRHAARVAPTVADFAERYTEQHAKLKKRPSSVRSDLTLLRVHILPRLGKHPLDDVTRADVTALAHSLRAHPAVANRVLALLSKMMNLAERWGLRPDGSNPVRHVERNRERARERFLSEAELGRLGDALAEAEQMGTETPENIAAIRLAVLTGARRGEILGLRWDWIDFDRGTARLPDSKSGAKTLQLGAPALAVLASLERRTEFVLPGRHDVGHVVDLNGVWRRIRDRAELDDVRLHDLRHTYASVGAGSGNSLVVLGSLLGHRSAQTTRRYSHLSESPLRDASEAIASRIAAAMNGEKPADVVPIRREG